VTKIAHDMVTKYGMSKRLGNVIVSDSDEVFLGRDYGHTQSHSESLQSIIDEEVARILEESYDNTIAILESAFGTDFGYSCKYCQDCK